MPERLILVRHGRSAHRQGGAWIDRTGVEGWMRAYDVAGIAASDTPPPALVRDAGCAAHVVSSDLPRAIQSAQRLAPGRTIVTSPLLREIPLPLPTRVPRRLPPIGWAMAIHLKWSLSVLRGRGPAVECEPRVREAAAWLSTLARDGPTLVVAHGVIRSALRDMLLRQGWRRAGPALTYRHWSDWRLVRAP